MITRTSFAVATLVLTLAAPVWAIQIPTVNLTELCPNYLRGAVDLKTQDDLRRDGVNLPVVCQAFGGEHPDWVLILTPSNQPATHVPGFTSEVACQQAVNIWTGRDRSAGDRPGHAVCVHL